MTLWSAKLTDLLLTARDPDEAVEYWARLLGGQAQDGRLLLGGGTSVIVREGTTEALAEIHFDASADVIAAAARRDGSVDGDVTKVTDPDGWVLRLERVDAVDELHVDAATLSHCTLTSPAPQRQRAWYEDLNFRLSDAIGDVFYWLRPNPVHHALAFSHGGAATIHHLAVELPDRASFIDAIDQVVALGGQLEFGPGRHMIGGNLFAYLRDRYGIRWELCAEMGRLAPDHTPGQLAPDERGRSVNTFGPQPPESFREPGGPAPAAAQD